MDVKVVVVGPKYQMNLGYIARVSKNFGVKSLCLVGPRANWRGRKAVMFAKHADDLLGKAEICKGLESATRDCAYVIGTTGIWDKARSGFRDAYTAADAARRAGRLGARRIALVIGRDDTGLSVDEISKCDIIAFVPTNPEYPVLNISHALAIMLYELTKGGNAAAYGRADMGAAGVKEMGKLVSAFDAIASSKRMRDKKTAGVVFRRMVRSAGLNAAEVHALITALK